MAEAMLFTYEETAKLLFRSRKTIYNMVYQHRLPRLRIKRSDHRPMALINRKTLARLAYMLHGPVFAAELMGTRVECPPPRRTDSPPEKQGEPPLEV